MDLSTLPNEMFSNVLKYANFGKLMMLRKMNQRIDSLVKRNKLCERLPVDKFEFMMNHPFEKGEYFVRLCLDKKDYQYFDCKYFTFSVATNPNISATLQFYLPKIQVSKAFTAGEMTINEDVFDVLYRHRANLKSVSRLLLATVDFKIGKDRARRFYDDIFPSVDNITIKGYGCQEIFNAEVLSGRKWKYLELENMEVNPLRDAHYIIDDNFISKVVVNCRTVVFLRSLSIRFTVLGVQDLLKGCIRADGAFNRMLNLGIVYGLNVPINNLEEMFNRILRDESPRADNSADVFKCKLNKITREGELPTYKLTFEDKVHAPYLRFYYIEHRPPRLP